MLVGIGNFVSAAAFLGSGAIPSAVTLWPKYVITLTLR